MDNNHHSTQTASHPQPNTTNRRYVRPRASITETPADFIVQVEMPGVDRQGLEITFESSELTLVGHRTAPVLPESFDLLHRESRVADFRRVFEVGSAVDSARISAGLDQGLLTLTLPKAETAKSRRIEINSHS